ncbi:MAG: alpha/beta fold hydrolase [Acidimicrobiales bacterium]
MARSDRVGDPTDIPPTRFAPARGARIAYQDFGSGPAVVAVPPMAQNIEMAWEWPAVRAMFERYRSFSRMVQFDKRGTGASDRRSRIPGLDERVDDLRAVMDDAGIDRAILYGASEGGPMCLLFAATYPDRVDGLIIHGSTACFDDPDLGPEERAARQRGIDYLVEKWGTEESILADLFSPSLASDPEYRQWLQRYERLAADRESLRELLDISSGFDVREVLPMIDVPTLVMHRSGDRVIPVAWGRAIAEGIEGARLVEHEGDDHFAFAGDTAWLDDMERFVTGSVQDRPDRVVTARSSAADRPRVRIRTLGRFSVEVDGQEVPTSDWGARLPRQLCKRLVAARGWPVTREELFELFWPDESDTRKLGARLSVQLSTVRRVLNGAVIADRQTVALNLDEVSTDLEEFYGAADEEQAVAAYSGEFLVEDRNEDWTMAARDEARSRFMRTARHLGSQAAERGDNDTAATMARRLIEADRYDDDAYRLLVQALADGCENPAARRAYETWSEAMADLDVTIPAFGELGITID